VSGEISRLSTHVLDTGLGRPASRIPALLEHLSPDGRTVDVGHGTTDGDGRIQLLNAAELVPGEYRMVLSTAGYFQDRHGGVFYPSITVQFLLPGDRRHYHIAVLASTYSYTTYRGS